MSGRLFNLKVVRVLSIMSLSFSIFATPAAWAKHVTVSTGVNPVLVPAGHPAHDLAQGFPENITADEASRWARLGYTRCDIDYMRGLREKALLDYIEKVPGRCLSPLFRPIPKQSREIFSQTAMSEAVSRAQEKARNWDATKASGLWPLALFLKAGYFIRVNFPEAGLSFPSELDDEVMKLVMIMLQNDAVWRPEHVTNDPLSFYSSFDVQNTIYETLHLADSVGKREGLLAAVGYFFSKYHARHKTTLAQHGLEPMTRALSTLHRIPKFVASVTQGDATAMQLLGNLLRLVKAGKSAFPNDRCHYGSLLNEAAYFLRYTQGKRSSVSSAPGTASLATLTPQIEEATISVYKASARLSPDRAEAIYAMTRAANRPCHYYNNRGYDLCEEKQEIYDKLFPYYWLFDDGQLVIKTSLPYEKVAPLYHSLKQVKAQFMRVTGSVVPVANDKNDTLTLVVYADPEDYRSYQLLLHDLSPWSYPGIYLESKGTIYAWQLDEYTSYGTSMCTIWLGAT